MKPKFASPIKLVTTMMVIMLLYITTGYAQTMPQIPNGDFENIPNKDWILQTGTAEFGSELAVENPSWYGSEYWQQLLDSLKKIPITSKGAYHGKYCLLIKSQKNSRAHLTNSFLLSVHPSSLHAFVKCKLNGMFDGVTITIDIFKNGRVVDSGRWQNQSTLKVRGPISVKDIDISMYSKSTSINKWKEITIPISNNSADADSAEIGIYAVYGNTFRIINDTYKQEFHLDYNQVWVDDLFFK